MFASNNNTFGEEPAVLVRKACLSYGPNAKILRNLSLTVPQNQIYGLLGPSGCGKTTLLNCIVGRVRLDSGSIFTKAKTTSELGYMPQDLALHRELSIREIFRFYGCMFSMSETKIVQRSRELLQFLELPNDEKVVSALSGGQQRRISFAVALFHDPKLLILDEPTVGLDPLLSQSIWEKLMEMASFGKTIIITTHYIEEARQANMIGMMRKGTILAEAPPAELLAVHNCNYLEDVFLKLCHIHDTTSNPSELARSQTEVEPYRLQEPLKTKEGFFSTSFKAQFMKNLCLLRRNLALTLFIVMLPIVQVGTFNFACGHDPTRLPLAVVNDEFLASGATSCFYKEHDACIFDLNYTHSASCRYLDKLRHRQNELGDLFKLVDYDTLEAGQRAVKRNDAWGLLHIPANFSMDLGARLSKGHNVEEVFLDGSVVDVWLDMSNHVIGYQMKREVVSNFVDAVKELLADCGVDTKYGSIPIKFNEAIYGDNNMPFVNYSSPAILCLCAFYLPAIYIGANIMAEKEGGIIERTLVAGVKTKEIILAHVTIEIGFLTLQTVSLMFVAYVVFHNPFVGDGLSIALLLTCIGINGMMFGLLLSVICSSQTDAAFFGVSTNFLLKFICGLLWPVEGMHGSLRSISMFLPLTLPVEAYRALSIRGWGLTNKVVLAGFASSIGWTLFFIALIIIICRYKRDVWVGKQ
ncbi:unnamed protein product [Bemisia tabaci]|uniref:ABC transporter domain-containing protein n=1 Tax=Bemisia tabaci TaxID=7038 RepID=A0A9P0AGY5_BEMTA|nr:unnamed protein product [Bemisia tabaci]